MTLRRDAMTAGLQATHPWAKREATGNQLRYLAMEAAAFASLDGLLGWMDDNAHELSAAIYAGNPDLPMGWDYVMGLVTVLRKGDA